MSTCVKKSSFIMVGHDLFRMPSDQFQSPCKLIQQRRFSTTCVKQGTDAFFSATRDILDVKLYLPRSTCQKPNEFANMVCVHIYKHCSAIKKRSASLPNEMWQNTNHGLQGLFRDISHDPFLTYICISSCKTTNEATLEKLNKK